MMTHWTRSKVDPAFLAQVTREAGGSDALVAAVAESNTGRHAWELWEGAGLSAASDLLCAKVAANLAAHVKGALVVDCAIVDFEGARLAGASPGARDRLDVEALTG
jgi:cobalt-precorrin-5B (C1)-methyltransferase